MLKILHVFGFHDWPEVWTKYNEHTLILLDGLWFEAFEKVCPCGARKTLNGPLRYSKDIDGGIMDANYHH